MDKNIEKLERKERIDKIIDKHFEQYKDVFQNLANSSDNKSEKVDVSNDDSAKLIKETFEEYDDVFKALADSDEHFDELTAKNFQKYENVFRNLAKGPE